jgi:hypothetical protein
MSEKKRKAQILYMDKEMGIRSIRKADGWYRTLD